MYYTVDEDYNGGEVPFLQCTKKHSFTEFISATSYYSDKDESRCKKATKGFHDILLFCLAD